MCIRDSAYATAGWRVRAWDTDADTLAIARIDVLDGLLRTAEDLAQCDLVVLAAYPDACLQSVSYTHLAVYKRQM